MKQIIFSKIYFRFAVQVCLLLLLVLINFSSFAQRCETHNYAQKNTSTDFPQNNIPLKSTSIIRDTLKDEVITVPVVIHILYNKSDENISDAQVMSQLVSLNNDYRKLNSDVEKVPAAFSNFTADTKIIFCLAKTDPNGRSTTGIIHKHTSEATWLADDAMKFSSSGGDNVWDAKRYLNIWVCSLFGRNLGYSSLPGTSVTKDGIVIQYTSFGTIGTAAYPFNKGRTVTHEVGHWLGLQHLWGDKSCGDDGIADTPPQQSYNNGCPSFPHVTLCSVNGNGDMFMNYMDFTDDACMYMFTKGQAIKMRSMFAAGGFRNTFLNSTACDSSAIQAAPLPENTNVTTVSFSLYPNPATKFVYLESKNTDNIIGKTIKIYDAFGAERISQVMKGTKNTISIDKLPSGIYFLRVANSNYSKAIKFIKE